MPLQSPYEPKRKDRFSIKLPIEFGLDETYVLSAEKPKYTRSPSGLLIPVPITIIFFDPVSPSTTQKLWTIAMSLSNIHLEEYYLPYDEFFKLYKFKDGFIYTLEMHGPVGDIVEKWEIKGIIQSIDFGDLNYGSDDIAECIMWIQPFNVRLLH